MPFKKLLSSAFVVALVGLLALAPRPALAVYGGPSHDPFFDTRDIYNRQAARDQIMQIVGVQQNIETQRAPIRTQIGALRQQITAQLTGGGAVDTGGLAALEQQIFALRRQTDALDLDNALQIRALLTPSELASIAQRHETRTGIEEQRDRILNPSQDPTSAYLPGDLFDDRLGYTRGVTLTNDQQRQMNSIKDGNRDAFRAIQQQRHVNRIQIQQLLMGEAPVTQAQFAPLLNEAATLKEQIDDLRLTMTIQIRALLTPEQLATAAELHQQLVTLRATESAANEAAQSGN
jgi:Spy/CpxP family protein refolding chaperone